MNRYSAYPRRVPGGFGYWAMIRLCRDGHPSPVMDIGDRRKVFHTEGEAAQECLKHMVAFMNGREIRGETFEATNKPSSAARVKAERLFMGGGKTIQVERKVTDMEAAR
ncbi:hypothetical protein ASC97_07170 [Rhizobium sp. Root1203]|uniref:hypothetical protein n=1 Tax=Rhizobium sp. Root1203 TaxID=1736427 RepID=UPI00071116DC|nr:hypothetical protein [Rhizobium sp. Root1203]KQV28121.1 hypothetical protein ASC97_07170 [Rhizobium sp. Root1203]